MSIYIAFLRGINVGGKNKIEMARLKKCFESLGYENVSTYINSGNVLFQTKESDGKKLVTEIEKAIEKKLNWRLRWCCGKEKT
ncbi:MAG: DUF1697 domain-containing protein [Candidatus Moranbacteria bacterium]|nr:DUF1697 domain-containing protein [Candidatus Moranbacteria bacterium]